jgi:hypothetical protein
MDHDYIETAISTWQVPDLLPAIAISKMDLAKEWYFICQEFSEQTMLFFTGEHGDFSDLICRLFEGSVDYRNRHFKLLVECMKELEQKEQDQCQISFS